MVEKLKNKKLIEVALPLEAINVASAREKSIRHGHPSTLHLWWARRPLAAARAVIFAQMVDDPSAHPDIFKTEKAQEKERQRLFRIIEDLVKWENTTNETVLQQASDEIWQSWRYTCAENADHPRAKELFDRFKLPAFHDPFAGGGALPLEAQRLGLESYASDLNPVAVLINKAMIEIPPKFVDTPPVNPESRRGQAHTGSWKGAQGLAEDVRYYGKWMRDEAEKQIGHLYPKVEVTNAMALVRPDLKKYVGLKLTVIAWLWARTVKSPNPAFANVDVPLASTFMLSTQTGKEAYVEPVIEDGSYSFIVKLGKPKDAEAAKNGTKLSRGAFRCLMSNSPFSYSYIDDEANAGRMSTRLLAIVVEGDRRRLYLSPTQDMEMVAHSAVPSFKPDTPSRGTWASNAQGRTYGFKTFGDYFMPRQLVTLTTFSDLVQRAHQKVMQDANKAGLVDDRNAGAVEYANALAVYLAFGVDKVANSVCSLVKWNNARGQSNVVFTRQAIPMMWDFADVNPFAGAAGDFGLSCEGTSKTFAFLPARPVGQASQQDASTQNLSADKVVSTDPPYYDNIGYADLSDFFYSWLRRSLKSVYPDLFATLAVPKAEELVACSYRHGSKDNAAVYFLNGMTKAMHRLAEQAHPAFPITIYYAFKQAESDGDDGTTNTGWDTFLAAVIEAGFAITGTWPMRTERPSGVKADLNALASSIILVCRQRAGKAPSATRREFVAALKAELPDAMRHLQAGNIAPVDLAQAAIGPGMAVYTRYASVIDAEGNSLPVRAALALINQTLDEALAEQEGDFDADTRWALTWFEQFGFSEGDYGVAEQLSTSKNTSVSGLVDAGILLSKSGKVCLLKPTEMTSDWNPTSDKRLTVWEMVHQLVRVLEANGEGAASVLVAKLGSEAETARELCYRLYTLCERKKRASEAMAYNGLVQSWPEITRMAREKPRAAPTGTDDLFNQE